MTSTKKGWFERNQGLITFLGYFLTVLIGGISLYNSNSKSTTALNLTQQQINRQRRRDSIDSIVAARNDSSSNKKFLHQESIDSQQLLNFQSQTLIAQEQLKYFKKQTSVAEMQFKKGEIAYQQQLDADRPEFIIYDFSIDSTYKPYLDFKFHVSNQGNRVAYVERIKVFNWDNGNGDLSESPADIDTISMVRTVTSEFTVEARNRIYKHTLMMIQILYRDKVKKGIQEYRQFLYFYHFNPLRPHTLDENNKKDFLARIRKLEKLTNTKYLTY